MADKGLGKHPVLLRQGAAPAQLLSIPSGGDLMLSLWEKFGTSVRATAPEARYYAEKTAPWVPTFLAQFLDLYAVYLFMDPRDLFLSANSMNSQRGYLAFGRQATGSDYDHAVTLAYRYTQYFESYRYFKSSGRKFSLIRYEDVARDPEPVFAHLKETTGLAPRLTADNDFYSEHRTTSSVEDSIGRWKRQNMSPQVVGILEHILSNALQELGYETSQDPTELSDLSMDFVCSQRADLRKLSFQNSKGQTIGDLGLEVNGSGNSFEMALDLPAVPASAIKEIWLGLSGDSGNMCELTWSGSDAELSKQCPLVRRYDAGRQVNTVRMKLAGHEHWHGAISRLNFKFSHGPEAIDFERPSIIRWLKVIPAEPETGSQSSTRRKPVLRFFQKLIGGP